MNSEVPAPMNKTGKRGRPKRAVIDCEQYRDKAKERGDEFYDCYSAVFRFLQCECDMGAYHGSSNVNKTREEEIEAARVAYEWTDISWKIDHDEWIVPYKHKNNVVRRNPKTGRWDYSR